MCIFIRFASASGSEWPRHSYGEVVLRIVSAQAYASGASISPTEASRRGTYAGRRGGGNPVFHIFVHGARTGESGFGQSMSLRKGIRGPSKSASKLDAPLLSAIFPSVLFPGRLNLYFPRAALGFFENTPVWCNTTGTRMRKTKKSRRKLISAEVATGGWREFEGS